MAIDLALANRQAIQLESHAKELSNLVKTLINYRDSLNISWKAQEMVYINSAIDDIIARLNQISSELNSIDDKVYSVAMQIHREEEEARRIAAEKAAREEARRAAEKAAKEEAKRQTESKAASEADAARKRQDYEQNTVRQAEAKRAQEAEKNKQSAPQATYNSSSRSNNESNTEIQKNENEKEHKEEGFFSKVGNFLSNIFK